MHLKRAMKDMCDVLSYLGIFPLLGWWDKVGEDPYTYSLTSPAFMKKWWHFNFLWALK